MTTFPRHNSAQSVYDPVVSWLPHPNPNSNPFARSQSLNALGLGLGLGLGTFDDFDPYPYSVNACVDWRETPFEHAFEVDLPGLREEEVKVELENDKILSISGERKKRNPDSRDKWYCVERKAGKFRRMFRLQENAKVDEIKASLANGLLTITIPIDDKKEKRFVKSIGIDSSAVKRDPAESSTGGSGAQFGHGPSGPSPQVGTGGGSRKRQMKHEPT